MTYEEFAALTRYYTNTDLTTFTDANITVLANAALENFAIDIEASKKDFFETSANVNLISATRAYAVPDEILGKLKRVETMELSTSNYRICDPVDYNLIETPLQEAEIVDFMAGKDPAYGVYDGYLYLFTSWAIAAITNGLRYWYSTWIQKFVSTDYTGADKGNDIRKSKGAGQFGLPRQLHELLARRVSIDYKTNRDRPLPLSAKEQLFLVDYQNALDKVLEMESVVYASYVVDTGENY